jgi:hypothetical protein
MLKNLSQLKAVVNGKEYIYNCDIDAPLPDVKESLFQFQKYIGQIEDNIKAQMEAQAAEKEKQEADAALPLPAEVKPE